MDRVILCYVYAFPSPSTSCCLWPMAFAHLFVRMIFSPNLCGTLCSRHRARGWRARPFGTATLRRRNNNMCLCVAIELLLNSRSPYAIRTTIYLEGNGQRAIANRDRIQECCPFLFDASTKYHWTPFVLTHFTFRSGSSARRHEVADTLLPGCLWKW